MHYRVEAFNTATASTNKIHDDAVARTYGFRGGLVPGVDVYAYLCHLPAERWGRDWLTGGTIAARFVSPVYDGDTVDVTATAEDDDALHIELHDPTGARCATAVARRASTLPIDRPLADWPTGPVPDAQPDASAAHLTSASLGQLEATFRDDRAPEYLDAVRETLPLFRADGVAHPGWLLRFANYVLSSNVRLGPWIHVSSDVCFHGVVRDGDVLTTRALVNRVWEAKGHEFVELDVLQLVDETPVSRVTHTAIFRPRVAS